MNVRVVLLFSLLFLGASFVRCDDGAEEAETPSGEF